MENFVYYNELYDLYHKLLTEKQCAYFEDYYFHNLSFFEMAENYEVSRNAIFKQVHIVVDRLKEYEEKLALYHKKQQLEKLIPQIIDLEIKEKLENLL